tara:strand:+ start:29836 stop:30390 length:555 start_codon:yes stop_codon:yes gene_type:complete
MFLKSNKFEKDIEVMATQIQQWISVNYNKSLDDQISRYLRGDGVDPGPRGLFTPLQDYNGSISWPSPPLVMYWPACVDGVIRDISGGDTVIYIYPDKSGNITMGSRISLAPCQESEDTMADFVRAFPKALKMINIQEGKTIRILRSVAPVALWCVRLLLLLILFIILQVVTTIFLLEKIGGYPF